MPHIIKNHEIITLLRTHLPPQPIIIEAGAFKGYDTHKLATAWPHGTIHAFEPIPELYTQLCARTEMLSNVHTHQLALSSSTGTAQMHVAYNPRNQTMPSQASSLHTPRERLHHSPMQYQQTITVPTIRLDEWCTQHNIEHIDLLWLDIQGHEYAVLHAAQEIMHIIDYVWVEVNFIPAYENQPSYTDFVAWLEQQNFTIIAQDFENTTDWFFGNLLLHRNTINRV
jgi:FkbM family methyltransferase